MADSHDGRIFLQPGNDFSHQGAQLIFIVLRGRCSQECVNLFVAIAGFVLIAIPGIGFTSMDRQVKIHGVGIHAGITGELERILALAAHLHIGAALGHFDLDVHADFF